MPKLMTYQVTHGILRAEFATVEVKASSPAKAVAKAIPLFEQISTADYEAGDVQGDFNPPYEVTDNNGTCVSYDIEGRPVGRIR